MAIKQKNTINEILHLSPQLRELLVRSDQINKLNQALSLHLDKDLAQNCRVANLEQGRLILATSSPAWNHNLRFIIPNLLSKLRQQPEWCGLISIESFVQPDSAPLISEKDDYNRKLPEAKKISKKGKQIIETAAKSIKSEKLAKALRKLANANPE